MQNNKMFWVFLTVAAAIVWGGALFATHKADRANTWVVKTYTVPTDRVDELKNSLNRLFSQKDGEPAGNAQAFGNGLIMVRAIEGYQHGVEQLIAQLDKTKPRQLPSIHIDYWLVTGQEDKKSNVDSLPAISSAIAAIDKLDGPRKYRILEHMSSNSMPGQEVNIHGYAADLKSQAWTVNDSLEFRLEFRSRLGEIRTETQVKPDEFLVLGQNAVDPEAHIGAEKVVKGAPSNVYYIVRLQTSK